MCRRTLDVMCNRRNTYASIVHSRYSFVDFLVREESAKFFYGETAGPLHLDQFWDELSRVNGDLMT